MTRNLYVRDHLDETIVTNSQCSSWLVWISGRMFTKRHAIIWQPSTQHWCWRLKISIFIVFLSTIRSSNQPTMKQQKSVDKNKRLHERQTLWPKTNYCESNKSSGSVHLSICLDHKVSSITLPSMAKQSYGKRIYRRNTQAAHCVIRSQCPDIKI